MRSRPALGIALNTTAIAGGTPGDFIYNNAGKAGDAAGVNYVGPGQITLATGLITATGIKSLNITQTWNNNATVFDAPLFMNITNTASAAYSNLIDVQVNGAVFMALQIDNSGNPKFVQASGKNIGFGDGSGGHAFNGPIYPQSHMWFQAANPIIYWDGSVNFVMAEEAVGTMTFHHRTNPAALHLYNTTDVDNGAPTNSERIVLDWLATSNVATIGSNKTGSGLIRDVALISGGTEVLRLLSATSPAGAVKFSNAASFTANGAVATVLGSLGPTGSHTTVQTWLTFVDSGGTTRYVPCF
jgi:hypothetical protein